MTVGGLVFIIPFLSIFCLTASLDLSTLSVKWENSTSVVNVSFTSLEQCRYLRFSLTIYPSSDAHNDTTTATAPLCHNEALICHLQSPIQRGIALIKLHDTSTTQIVDLSLKFDFTHSQSNAQTSQSKFTAEFFDNNRRIRIDWNSNGGGARSLVYCYAGGGVRLLIHCSRVPIVEGGGTVTIDCLLPENEHTVYVAFETEHFTGKFAKKRLTLSGESPGTDFHIIKENVNWMTIQWPVHSQISYVFILKPLLMDSGGRQCSHAIQIIFRHSGQQKQLESIIDQYCDSVDNRETLYFDEPNSIRTLLLDKLPPKSSSNLLMLTRSGTGPGVPQCLIGRTVGTVSRTDFLTNLRVDQSIGEVCFHWRKNERFQIEEYRMRMVLPECVDLQGYYFQAVTVEFHSDRSKNLTIESEEPINGIQRRKTYLISYVGDSSAASRRTLCLRGLSEDFHYNVSISLLNYDSNVDHFLITPWRQVADGGMLSQPKINQIQSITDSYTSVRVHFIAPLLIYRLETHKSPLQALDYCVTFNTNISDRRQLCSKNSQILIPNLPPCSRMCVLAWCQDLSGQQRSASLFTSGHCHQIMASDPHVSHNISITITKLSATQIQFSWPDSHYPCTVRFQLESSSGHLINGSSASTVEAEIEEDLGYVSWHLRVVSLAPTVSGVRESLWSQWSKPGYIGFLNETKIFYDSRMVFQMNWKYDFDGLCFHCLIYDIEVACFFETIHKFSDIDHINYVINDTLPYELCHVRMRSKSTATHPYRDWSSWGERFYSGRPSEGVQNPMIHRSMLNSGVELTFNRPKESHGPLFEYFIMISNSTSNSCAIIYRYQCKDYVNTRYSIEKIIEKQKSHVDALLNSCEKDHQTSKELFHKSQNEFKFFINDLHTQFQQTISVIPITLAGQGERVIFNDGSYFYWLFKFVGVPAGLFLFSLILVVLLVVSIRSKKDKEKKYSVSTHDTSLVSPPSWTNQEVFRPLMNDFDYELPTLVNSSQQLESMPQTVSMSDFLNYIESLSDNNSQGFIEQLTLLDSSMIKERSNRPYRTCHVARLVSNSYRNKDSDIVPYDQTRVVISGQSDYINASYIFGMGNEALYIAAQGPISSTVPDFWQLIWEHSVRIIVMLNNESEEDQSDCWKYWPEEVDAVNKYSFFFSVEFVSEELSECYTIRKFILKKGAQEKEVTQFHFLDWPRDSLPKPTKLREFLRHIDTVASPLSSAELQFLVHGDVGTGRTGTFIAIHYLIDRLQSGGDGVNVFDTVMMMRDYRPGLVESVMQYSFIHTFIHFYINDCLTLQ